MKLITLSRVMGAAGLGTLVFAGVPALSAQTAAELNSSGMAKLQQGNLGGAVEDFNAGLKQKPDDPGLHVNRATAETAEGSYVSAIEDYNEVIKAKPKQANGYLLRGLANFLNGDIDHASKDYAKAIELDPKDATLYLYRGLLDDCDNNQDAAVNDFTKAVELSGGENETANYAQLYRGLDFRLRGPTTDEQLGNSDGWKNAWTKTVAAYMSGKLSEEEFFKKAGADVSDDKSKNREKAEAFYFAGRVHVLTGDKAGAQKDFSSSISLQFPADVERKLAQTELDRLGAH